MAFILFLHVGITAYCLKQFFTMRDQTGFHLGMNIAMLTGGFFGLMTGIVFIDYFPFHFVLLTMVAAVAGAFTGAVTGLFYDIQTALSGVSNGFMMGLMGPMIGSAAGGFLMLPVMLEIVYLFLTVLALTSVAKS
ncbi:hypothetical protein ACFO0S_03955 [Chryseomicrobium palamuruense]|uniref:Uncharacterized protein n=1 Tax=Chryseomicrobium palamuruense TaxID=682973 RepID=A0ABV8UUH9_9BACL